MSEIINLRRARKRRDRAEAGQAAAENRARFGRTAAEKLRDQKAAERRRTAVEGARLDSEPGDDPPG